MVGDHFYGDFDHALDPRAEARRFEFRAARFKAISEQFPAGQIGSGTYARAAKIAAGRRQSSADYMINRQR